MIPLTAVPLITLVLAVAPLSEPQQAQVDTATDGPVFDEAALYPLLMDATTWKLGDRVGASFPDYQAVLDEPGAYRGDLFLIEGDFVGIPRSRRDKGLSVGGLNRPGPWDGKLEQWGVVVTRADGSHDSVLIYLVDPPVTPRAGVKVQIVARFYKVWEQPRLLLPEEELEGLTAETAPVEPFLVFVGRSATVIGTGSGAAGTDGVAPGTLLIIAGGAVLILLVGWWRIRAMTRPRLTPAQQRRMERQRAAETGVDMQTEDAFDDDEEPLPDDPIEALEEMERRRRAAAEVEPTSPELEALKAAKSNGKRA